VNVLLLAVSIMAAAPDAAAADAQGADASPEHWRPAEPVSRALPLGVMLAGAACVAVGAAVFFGEPRSTSTWVGGLGLGALGFVALVAGILWLATMR
jgi:hypothetical protein